VALNTITLTPYVFLSSFETMAVSFLVEETGIPGENHRPVNDKLYYIMLYSKNKDKINIPNAHSPGMMQALCFWY
jgi:hypothetical protein